MHHLPLDVLMHLHSIVTTALEILRSPAAWTQGASARDADGQLCPAWGATATCWCLTGALDAAAYRVGKPSRPKAKMLVTDSLADLWDLLADAYDWTSGPIEYNDAAGRTHEEVLEALGLFLTRVEDAIEEVSEREGEGAGQPATTAAGATALVDEWFTGESDESAQG